MEHISQNTKHKDLCEELINKAKKSYPSNHTIELILKTSPESFYIIDIYGKIELCNHILAQRFNQTIDNMIGKSIFEFIPDCKHHIEEMITTKNAVQFSEERNNQFFSHILLPILDQNGDFNKILVTGIDITNKEQEIIKNKEAIQKSNQILSAILENTDTMAVLLDCKFNFIWVNKAYADTCKHDPYFFVGKNHFDLYPSKENEEIFKQVVNTGEPAFLTAKEFVFPDQPDRGLTWWDWSLIPVRNQQNEIINLAFTLKEVTNQIMQERHIRALGIMVDSAPNAVTIHDNQGGFLYANKKALELHQYTLEEFKKIPLNKLDTPETTRLFLNRIKQIEELGEATFEVSHFKKDGTILPLEISAKPILWDNKEVILSIGRDISERKQAEEELKKSEIKYKEIAEKNAELLKLSRKDAESKALLLHEVNHRVKNNLTAIMGLIYAQLRFSNEKANFKAILKEVAKKIETMAMVHNMLSASMWEPLPLSSIFIEIMSNITKIIDNDKSLVYHFTSEDIKIPSHSANAIALILFELSTNSIKYGFQESNNLEISLNGKWDNEFFKIRFSDTGSGYPEPLKPNLGLYLVKKLVTHDLRGQVAFSNENGATTDFTIDSVIGISHLVEK